MAINRNNYELFIIDYFDGKLDTVESAELFFFLSQNPDLEDELNSFKNLKLPADEPKFNNLINLKKDFKDIADVTDDNYEEFCIAYPEGDLDERSGIKLFTYLEGHPDKKRNFELYQQISLKPDMLVIFPDRNSLKKQKSIVLSITRTLFYAGAAAAAIVFLVLLTNIFRKDSSGDLYTTYSENKEKKEINVKSANVEQDIENSIVKNIVAEKSNIRKEKIADAKHGNDYPEKTNSETFLSAIKPIEVTQIDYNHNPGDLIHVIVRIPTKQTDDSPVAENSSLLASIRKRISSFEIAAQAENINIWTLAEAGVKGLNYLTESDVQLARKLNEDGKLSGISIESETFGFSTPIKNR